MSQNANAQESEMIEIMLTIVCYDKPKQCFVQCPSSEALHKYFRNLDLNPP